MVLYYSPPLTEVVSLPSDDLNHHAQLKDSTPGEATRVPYRDRSDALITKLLLVLQDQPASSHNPLATHLDTSRLGNVPPPPKHIRRPQHRRVRIILRKRPWPHLRERVAWPLRRYDSRYTVALQSFANYVNTRLVDAVDVDNVV